MSTVYKDDLVGQTLQEALHRYGITVEGPDGNSLTFIPTDERKEIQTLFTKPFLKSVMVNDKVGLVIGKSLISNLNKAANIGPRVFARTLEDICHKTTTNPGSFLTVSNRTFVVPTNLDEGADSMVHRLISLYDRLGFEMRIGDSTVSIPEFSKGWITNITYSFDLILKTITSIASKGDKEMMPHNIRNDFGRTLISMIVFKWANRHNLSGYLKLDVKKRGNLSEVAFLDIVKGWGTNLTGSIAGRMASALYQLTSIIAGMPGTGDIVPRTFFMSAGDIRKKCSPSRQILETKGKEKHLVQKGEVNVLRFDNVRFLLPAERLKAKNFNESSDLERKIREFDALSVKDRNYPELEKNVKDYFDKNSKSYFHLRRLARERLYAIKEVKREAKQSDQIPDSDFSNNEYIESICKQADLIIADINRRSLIKERLLVNILSALVPDSNETGARVDL